MIRISAVFIGLLATVCAVSYFDVFEAEWEAFKLEYGKEYDSDIEDKFRMKIFLENKNKIAQHNQLYEKGHFSYKLGINKYSDLSHNEFVAQMTGFNRSFSLRESESEVKRIGEPIYFVEPANVELPKSVDWRKEGAVTRIKDQGECGSCWAFSATGALEGQHFRKSKKLVSLSEQNLIDCSAKYGNKGCDGGLTDQAFKYITANGGIATEKKYPYKGRANKCRYDPKNSGATCKGFVDIPRGNEQKLTAAIATEGPVSVAIDTDHDSFHLYESGIYYKPKCSSEKLDHAVLVVGYGTSGGQDYYLVKNSWGTTWGEEGYIKMARNKNNNCGIATEASFPLV